MKSLAEVVSAFPREVVERYSFHQAHYEGALKPITGVVCREHGPFQQYAAQFRKGRGCPSCGADQRIQSRKTPAQEYFEKVSEIHGGKYDYSKSVYERMNSKITVVCPVHGEFSISANHHYYRKQGCGLCEAEAKKERILNYRHLSSQAKINNTGKDFFDKCREVHGGKYIYPNQEYRGAKEKVTAVCPLHGEFQQAAWAHLSGKGCFECGAADPKWERELLEFLESNGCSVQRRMRILDGKEIDLWIEDRKFGIELHGLHWHTEATRHKDYHREKWQIASDKGIRLIQVFEDEWLEKSEIIKNRLLAMLGKAKTYHARKCQVQKVESAVGRKFLEQTHIQGGSVASLYYALMHDQEIVAVASFGLARAGSMLNVTGNGAWEVIRYSSSGRVQGGFSKLFAAFLREVNPVQVISYCDLRYGDGRLYQSTGFTLDSITPPDYWWVPNGKVQRVARYVTQKHKIPHHPILKKFYEPGMTESQVCHAAGWQKIYGVGHQKWVWKPIDPPSPTC